MRIRDLTLLVKDRVKGNWDQIISALARDLQPMIAQPGKHFDCPHPGHGGKRDFRVDKDFEENGRSICTCTENTDGFATLMWINGWDFVTTVKAIADYMNIDYEGDKPDLSRCIPLPEKREDPRAVEKKEAKDRYLKNELQRVWNEAIPLTASEAEPARLYMARRGLSIHKPSAMRFHPNLQYLDEVSDKKSYWPAIVSAATGANGSPVTIHRIYITTEGRKAPYEDVKKWMAYPSDRQLSGGAVRLTPFTGKVIAVTEGIETGLAVIEGYRNRVPVWATGSDKLLAHFEPPEGTELVLAFADKDRSEAGQKASRELVRRMWAKGIKASAIVPSLELPIGSKTVDWLDVLNKKGMTGFPSLEMIEGVIARRIEAGG